VEPEIALWPLVYGTIFGLVLTLTAVLLRGAVRIVAHFDLPFGEACKVSLLSCAGAVGALMFALAVCGVVDPGEFAMPVAIPISIVLATALICGSVIKQPDTERPIGPVKGLLVALIVLGLLGASAYILLITGGFTMPVD